MKGLKMDGKKVSESLVIMSQIMMLQDANPVGNVHGGVILKLCDECGGIIAARHARRPCSFAQVPADMKA